MTYILIPWLYFNPYDCGRSRNGAFNPYDKLADITILVSFLGECLTLNPKSTTPFTGESPLLYLKLFASYEIFKAVLPTLYSVTFGDARSYYLPTREP